MDYAEYDQNHCNIVESSLKAIISYYNSHNHEEKRSILLCLDRYLDPYYQYKLSYKNQIFEWLQNEFQNTQDLKIKEDIFDLIDYYSEIRIPNYERDDYGNLVQIN
ncbi:hypothetical protein [Sulfurovum sp.]|uniref:hypothetical protein n=1 Tax=Sulfurovum sp. TaxID=1969726 RepID=UPI003565C93F